MENEKTTWKTKNKKHAKRSLHMRASGTILHDFILNKHCFTEGAKLGSGGRRGPKNHPKASKKSRKSRVTTPKNHPKASKKSRKSRVTTPKNHPKASKKSRKSPVTTPKNHPKASKKSRKSSVTTFKNPSTLGRGSLRPCRGGRVYPPPNPLPAGPLASRVAQNAQKSRTSWKNKHECAFYPNPRATWVTFI